MELEKKMERYGIEEKQAVERVLASGEFSRFFANFKGGKEVQAFEEEFAQYVGVKHAVSVSNGTVALEVALLSCLYPGDEVITTPLTFIATATAILRAGAKPVFVDVIPETLCIDETKVQEAITKRTRAIVPVSLLGMPCNMSALRNIADDEGLLIVEDAAQALGAKWQNRNIGAWGELATFSLQESKTITSFGEGGMIVTDDDVRADLCRHIRNHGNTYGSIRMPVSCTNARMTEVQAAFGREQLRKLNIFIKIQQVNAGVLCEELDFPLQSLYPGEIRDWSTYYLVPMMLGLPDYGQHKLTRDEFMKKCEETGISKGLPGQNIGYYKRLICDSPVFQRCVKSKMPNAEWAVKNILLFDIHRWNKTPDDMLEYAKIMNSFFKE